MDAWSYFPLLEDCFKKAKQSRNAYFIDLIFCTCCLPKQPPHPRRFSFSFLTWLPWFAYSGYVFCKPCLKSCDTLPPFCPWLLNTIATTAHTETLGPIFESLRGGCHKLDIEQEMRVLLADSSLWGGSFSALYNYLVIIWRSLRDSADILFRVLAHPKLFFAVFRNFFQLFELLLLANAVEIFFSKHPLFFCNIITTYELGPCIKALVATARIHSSRIIHIMHGQRLPTYKVTMATDLVLLSKIDEPWFKDRIDPSTRIWTTGHPRLESIKRKVGSAQKHDSTRLPRIAFFSQPIEGDYSCELRQLDWSILSGLKGVAEMRLRAHPRENSEEIQKDLEQAGIDFAVLSTAGLADDLRWCDAVASSWSTVSMEAAACGRGIFWTCSSPERYEASQELRDHGIGVLIQEADAWEQYLAQWKQGGWQTPVLVDETRLRELGMIGDSEKSWIERLEIELGQGEVANSE